MQASENIQLIINADDYGYSPCISRGILAAAKQGAITATGILANAADIGEQLTWLDGVANLDLGVHLNLSWGKPLTTKMSNKLSTFAGNFPNVHKMNFLLMTKQITLQDVAYEWEAQVEICQNQYRKMMFLNSHEHIHMLPSLFPLTIKLAKTFNIPHVRLSRADWSLPLKKGALVRNILIESMYALNWWHLGNRMPIFIGLGQSGKLDLAYLEKILSKLKFGKVYELMCHPGHFDPKEILEDRLKGYHDWEGELNLLQGSDIFHLYHRLGIQLSHY